MAIPENSRYNAANLKVVDTDRGVVRALYQPARIYVGQRFATVQAKEGDTFDLLAYRLYGDPLRWWRIAEANPQVFHPGPIPPGTIIRVPA